MVIKVYLFYIFASNDGKSVCFLKYDDNIVLYKPAW